MLCAVVVVVVVVCVGLAAVVVVVECKAKLSWSSIWPSSDPGCLTPSAASGLPPLAKCHHLPSRPGPHTYCLS